MKFKNKIIYIFVPLLSITIAFITSYVTTQESISNQKDMLKLEYKVKFLEKRISIIDEAAKLIGSAPGTDDMFIEYTKDHFNNKTLNIELSKTLSEYNSRWQSNIVLSTLYFGESANLAIRKMSNESAPWWNKNKKLQYDYLNAMMNDLMLEMNNNN